MKFILIPILLAISILNPKNPLVKEIKLNKEQIVLSTFSGDIMNDNSFHLIIIKNTSKKQHEIIPVSYINGDLAKLPIIGFKRQPSIISYHSKENNLSVILSYKNKNKEYFNVLDIDIKTGDYKISESNPLKNFKTVIRNKDKNFLLFSDKAHGLKIVTVESSSLIKNMTIALNTDNEKVLKSIFNNGIAATNTDEYVKNGPLGNVKAYSNNKEIIITSEDIKAMATSIIKIPINKTGSLNIKAKEYSYQPFNKLKKATSYKHKNKIYRINISKEQGLIDVINLSNDKIKKVNLSKETGISKSKGFIDLSTFFKKASKAKNEPTITINQLKNGNVLARVDYVLINEYGYNYNWWWQHHWFNQHMMWQQQQMMHQIQHTIPKGFGPNMPLENFYFVSEDSHSFEIVLSPESDILSNNGAETVHLKIDKKKHIDKLKEQKEYKHASSVFVNGDSTFRCFAYFKKSKTFQIFEKEVND
jgi:hypothetical protein